MQQQPKFGLPEKPSALCDAPRSTARDSLGSRGTRKEKAIATNRSLFSHPWAAHLSQATRRTRKLRTEAAGGRRVIGAGDGGPSGAHKLFVVRRRTLCVCLKARVSYILRVRGEILASTKSWASSAQSSLWRQVREKLSRDLPPRAGAARGVTPRQAAIDDERLGVGAQSGEIVRSGTGLRLRFVLTTNCEGWPGSDRNGVSLARGISDCVMEAV